MATYANLRSDEWTMRNPLVATELAEGYEKGSETWNAGAIVTADSNGLLNQSIAAGSNFVGNGERIAGITVSDASGVGNTVCNYQMIRPGQRFLFRVWHTGANNGSAVPAITHIDTAFELRRDANAGYMVALDATSNPVVRVVGVPKFVAGVPNSPSEVHGWVECEFIAAELVNAS